jgi:uncharacterized GH25 family protein
MSLNFKSLAILFALVFATTSVFSQTTGGLKGKVRGSEGEVLRGATVTARRDGADIKSVKTDRKGEFALEGLKPGKYNFVFEMSGYTPGIRYDVPIDAGIPLNLGDKLILSKDDSNIVFLRGSVFDKNGKSLQGARVEVHKIAPDGKRRLVSSSYSNYSGEFAFRQTDSDAIYEITASLSGKSATKELRVDSAGIHRVSITLDMER